MRHGSRALHRWSWEWPGSSHAEVRRPTRTADIAIAHSRERAMATAAKTSSEESVRRKRRNKKKQKKRKRKKKKEKEEKKKAKKQKKGEKSGETFEGDGKQGVVAH